MSVFDFNNKVECDEKFGFCTAEFKGGVILRFPISNLKGELRSYPEKSMEDIFKEAIIDTFGD